MAPTPNLSPKAYRVSDFCRLFGLSRATVYRLIDQEKLGSVLIGRRRLILADAAEALLRGGDDK